MLLDHNAAIHQATGDAVTVSQDEGEDSGREVSVVHGDHREGDRQPIVETGADHRQGLAVLVRGERRRVSRGRLEVLPGVAIVLLDPSAVVLTRIVVEPSVVPVPIVVFKVAVAVASAASPLRTEIRQVVDQEALALVLRMEEASGSADPEEHGIDRPTLIGGSIERNSTTGLRAPAEVILPGGSGVTERAVDVHLHDIVVRAVDEVDRQLDGVGLAAVEATGDHCLDEVVLDGAVGIQRREGPLHLEMALPDATGERQHAIAVQGLGLAGLVHERWREGHVAERPRGVEVREAPTLRPEGSWGAEPVCHDLLVDGRINGNAGRILAAPAVLTLYGAG